MKYWTIYESFLTYQCYFANNFIKDISFELSPSEKKIYYAKYVTVNEKRKIKNKICT